MPITSNNVVAPFPATTWFFGDSTTAGLARACSLTTGTQTVGTIGNDATWPDYVPWLQGWPRWLSRTSRGYNGAVPGHYSWEVENDLFGDYPTGGTPAGARPAPTGGIHGEQPNQYGLAMGNAKPNLVVIMCGVNEVKGLTGFTGSYWSSVYRDGNMLYWRASLINALKNAGFDPYGNARPGHPQYLFMTMLPPSPLTNTAVGLNGTQVLVRNGANANILAHFGSIGDLSASGVLTGGADPTTTWGAYNYQITSAASGYPTINLNSTTGWGASGGALRCCVNVEAVLQGGAAANKMDPIYNTGTDNGFGLHLNILGEQKLATAMQTLL